MEALLVVVGGAIAIAGSVIVSRYELTRRHRVTIHATLLPKLTKGWREDNVEIGEEIEREAIIASRGDRAWASALLALLRATRETHHAVRLHGGEDRRQLFEAANGRSVEMARRYADWISCRFRFTPKRLIPGAWRRRGV